MGDDIINTTCGMNSFSVKCEDPSEQKKGDSIKELERNEKKDVVQHNPFWTIAKRALDACDYCGERLAYFFGITSPKFDAEIKEYHRMQQEQKGRQSKERMEYSGWNETSTTHGHEDSPTRY